MSNFLTKAGNFYTYLGRLVELTNLKPGITTKDVSAITGQGAIGGGITYDFHSPISERGLVWDTSSNPTIEDNRNISPGEFGSFDCSLLNLSEGSTYYIKAYAISSGYLSYGNEKTFLATGFPTIDTSTVWNIILSGASCGGTVTLSGGTNVTDRGVCWATTQTPTILNSHTHNGSGLGAFTSAITGLSSSTNYYVRAFATNSTGTGYGNQVSFSSAYVLPALTTTSISSIIMNSAISGGNISSDGGYAITDRGVCWNTSANPTISNSHTHDGTGTGSFSSTLYPLSSNTLYYVRAYATNSAGTTYGEELTFTSATFSILDTSGGTITTSGDWRIHTFSQAPGNFNVYVPLTTVEYLIVGAGASGHPGWADRGNKEEGGGGGGGGEVLVFRGTSLAVGNYSVVAGSQNSVFNGYTARYGGSGYYRGGNSGNGYIGGDGETVGYIGDWGYNSGGGGAGNSANGGDGTSGQGGNGAQGTDCSIGGSVVRYGSGGGGGALYAGTGGSGAGNGGYSGHKAGYAATINGCGGGGGYGGIGGGSPQGGIVIIRYKFQ
jgi:hypothetical protein